jgi:hypothetical protein
MRKKVGYSRTYLVMMSENVKNEPIQPQLVHGEHLLQGAGTNRTLFILGKIS